jgi:hypothetical protein
VVAIDPDAGGSNLEEQAHTLCCPLFFVADLGDALNDLLDARDACRRRGGAPLGCVLEWRRSSRRLFADWDSPVERGRRHQGASSPGGRGPMTVSGRAASLLRRWARLRTGSLRREQVHFGDFARCAPRRDAAGRCVYEALAADLVQSRLERLAGAGVIITPDEGASTEAGLGEETRVVRVATIDAAAELQRLDELFGSAQLDWVVVDRCLQFVQDIPAGLARVVGWLKPGGTLVSLFVGLGRAEPESRRPLWIVLPYGARRLHEECVGLESIEIEHRGNVALALAWLYGLGAEELTDAELRSVDGAYPLVVAATAARRSVARGVGG